METRYANLTIFALIAATLVYDYVLNPHLPAVIPSHWNIYGQADGFSPKRTVYFSSILILLLDVLLLNVIPRLPSRLPVKSSLPTFNYMIVAAALFMAYVNVVALQIVLHPGLPISNLIFTGVLLLFVVLGNVLGKTRRNQWSGIRLPWTLASDANWIATHRFAGRLWVGTSLAGIVLLWLGLSVLVLLPAFLLLTTFVPMLYSYLLFKRSGGDGEEPA